MQGTKKIRIKTCLLLIIEESSMLKLRLLFNQKRKEVGTKKFLLRCFLLLDLCPLYKNG